MIHGRIVLFNNGKNVSNLNDPLDHIKVIFKPSWYSGRGVVKKKEEDEKRKKTKRWIKRRKKILE